MNVEILKGRKQAVPDDCAVIVVDVLRAFSTTDMAMQVGVEDILLCQSLEEAQEIKKEYPSILTIGELNGFQIDGFDLGNSPYYLSKLAPSPKQVAIKTTNGVAAVFSVLNAQKVLVASFRNAKNIATYAKKWSETTGIPNIYIVCSAATGEEDFACARYIRSHILGLDDCSSRQVVEAINKCKAAQKFVMSQDSHFPSEDLALCAIEREKGEVLEVKKNNWIELKKALI